MVEHQIVDLVVAGSTPVVHPDRKKAKLGSFAFVVSEERGLRPGNRNR
ncbi:MAG: hypothetical protein G01um101420_890 [Parcubacteria group bacterium Gr01-1014_20]|nr:MAG: hypothetical protein G01um101420_890 [Parcubacteria group bacterium Gr01-1014_20]